MSSVENTSGMATRTFRISVGSGFSYKFHWSLSRKTSGKLESSLIYSVLWFSPVCFPSMQQFYFMSFFCSFTAFMNLCGIAESEFTPSERIFMVSSVNTSNIKAFSLKFFLDSYFPQIHFLYSNWEIKKFLWIKHSVLCLWSSYTNSDLAGSPQFAF